MTTTKETDMCWTGHTVNCVHEGKPGNTISISTSIVSVSNDQILHRWKPELPCLSAILNVYHFFFNSRANGLDVPVAFLQLTEKSGTWYNLITVWLVGCGNPRHLITQTTHWLMSRCNTSKNITIWFGQHSLFFGAFAWIDSGRYGQFQWFDFCHANSIEMP